MKTRVFVTIVMVIVAGLLFTEPVRADEITPTHTITITGNYATEIGCIEGDGMMDWTYTLAGFSSAGVCTFTNPIDGVGVAVSVVDDEYLDTLELTGAPGIFYTDTWSSAQIILFWDPSIYTGTFWVTYTVTMFPQPTPTIDWYAWSREYHSGAYKTFLPFVARNWDGTGGAWGGPADPIGSDTTWWAWAQTIEAFFAPVMLEIVNVRGDITGLNDQACGNPWTAYSPPADPLAIGAEIELLSGDPGAQKIAVVMGWSLGRPMAWLRSIQASNSILGLNFFVMLVYFLAAGIGWIVFVTILVYSMRLIRLVVSWIIRLYELIPFKAT